MREVYGIGVVTIPALTLGAGSSVSFEYDEMALRVGRLEALGTAEEPVVLEGGDLTWGLVEGSPLADTLRLANTKLINMRIGSSVFGGNRSAVALEVNGLAAKRTEVRIEGGTRATIRGGTLDSSHVVMTSGDASLEDVTFLRAGSYRSDPFFWSAAPAIRVVGGRLTVTDCEIRDGSEDALRMEPDAADGTSITGCNLVANAGFGVANLSPFTIDATGNWWGDPAGPEGPAGDGASGDVVVEPVRTEPVQR